MPSPDNCDDQERTVKNARAVLACFRTPLLREALAEFLTGRADAGSAPGPLRQVPWLSHDGAIDAKSLNADIARLESMLSPLNLLRSGPVTDWPESHGERMELALTIFDRVFAGSTRRRSLTETEVNAALSVLVADVPGVRRFAVDTGIVDRTPDGSSYWRVG